MNTWKVDANDHSFELTELQLLDLLLSRVIKKERPDMEALSLAFATYLQDNKALGDVSLTQLISMAMEVGYFYRIFTSQNQVEFEATASEANTNESNDTPPD